MNPGELAHEEDGSLECVVEFDYETVEAHLRRNLFEAEAEGAETAGLSEREREGAVRMFGALVRWLWQDGMKNEDGVAIRAIIVCWVFIPELHPLTLTQMARGSGRFKQSLGRWMDDFKRRFPYIKTPHMRVSKKRTA